MIHANKLLFVDEVGSNTSQTKDGLLHPEIQLLKTAQGSAVPSTTSNLTSTISPSDLNLTQGLTGILKDNVVMYH